jgi:hypothetical protein
VGTCTRSKMESTPVRRFSRRSEGRSTAEADFIASTSGCVPYITLSRNTSNCHGLEANFLVAAKLLKARGRTSGLRDTVALFQKESSTKVSVQRTDHAIAGVNSSGADESVQSRPRVREHKHRSPFIRQETLGWRPSPDRGQSSRSIRAPFS